MSTPVCGQVLSLVEGLGMEQLDPNFLRNRQTDFQAVARFHTAPAATLRCGPSF